MKRLIEIELKQTTHGKTFRKVSLDSLPSVGDRIYLDTYPNNGPLVEEKYKVSYFYKIFKSAQPTKYIALVDIL